MSFCPEDGNFICAPNEHAPINNTREIYDREVKTGDVETLKVDTS